MSPFDLLFLAVLLATMVTVALAATAAIRGRPRRASRIFAGLSACLGGYLVLAMAVDFDKPQHELHIGDPWCFDDWCLTVAKVDRSVAASEVNYELHLEIFSRARRVAQRARGAWIYLIDDRGHLYSPESDPRAAPLDVRLEPGESVTTLRNFRVPSEVGRLGLITGHGGRYCGAMNLLIIGAGGCLFGKPALVRIQ